MSIVVEEGDNFGSNLVSFAFLFPLLLLKSALQPYPVMRSFHYVVYKKAVYIIPKTINERKTFRTWSLKDHSSYSCPSCQCAVSGDDRCGAEVQNPSLSFISSYLCSQK